MAAGDLPIRRQEASVARNASAGTAAVAQDTDQRASSAAVDTVVAGAGTKVTGDGGTPETLGDTLAELGADTDGQNGAASLADVNAQNPSDVAEDVPPASASEIMVAALPERVRRPVADVAAVSAAQDADATTAAEEPLGESSEAGSPARSIPALPIRAQRPEGDQTADDGTDAGMEAPSNATASAASGAASAARAARRNRAAARRTARRRAAARSRSAAQRRAAAQRAAARRAAARRQARARRAERAAARQPQTRVIRLPSASSSSASGGGTASAGGGGPRVIRLQP